MMACSACGTPLARRPTICPSCGAIHSLVEVSHGKEGPDSFVPFRHHAGWSRLSTGDPDVDRVLGGGIVRQALILLAGPPGLGKSTLALRIAAAMPGPVLYVAAEEAPEAVMERAERLGITEACQRVVRLTTETHIERLLALHGTLHPVLTIIDSLPTIWNATVAAHPGSPTQLKLCALQLRAASPALLLAHVTSQDMIAGPRAIQHLVDVLLYLDEDEERDGQEWAVLRIEGKNRYGPVHERALIARDMGTPGRGRVDYAPEARERGHDPGV